MRSGFDVFRFRLGSVYFVLHNTWNTTFGGQVGLTLGTSVGIHILGLVTGVVVARILGPVGRGELAAIQLWGSFIVSLVVGGISQSLVYFVARNPMQARQYLASGICLSIFAGAPLIIIGVLSLPWLLQAQNKEVLWVAQWYTVCLFFVYTINWMPLSILSGLKRFAEWNMLRPLGNVGWFLVVIAGLALGNITPPILALGFLISNTVMSMFVLGMVFRNTVGSCAPAISQWPAIVKYGLPITASFIPTSLLESGRLPQIFIAAALPAENLGFLAVAVAWSGITALVPQAVGQILFPRVATIKETYQQGSEIARATRVVILILGGLCGLLAILAPVAIPFLFGGKFSPAVPAAILMVGAGGMAGVKIILGQGLRGSGKPAYQLLGEVVGVGVTIIPLPFLLSLYGVTGAALAVLFGETAGGLVLLWLAKWHTHSPLSVFLLPSYQDLAAMRILLRQIWTTVRHI